MKSRIPKAYTIITMIAIGALFGVLLLHSGSNKNYKDTPYIKTGSKTIPVIIADTALLREKGLSGSANLDPGTGMLFIFDQPEVPGFWMKDMNYPIDIVWINEELKVISITTAHPESYPEVFYPPSEVKYVLEINAGDADEIAPNQKLEFYKI